MYGRGAKSIAEQYGISVAQAQSIIDGFFGRYPKAKIFLQRQVTHARMHGYVVNMFGRRRRLPDITSKDMGKKGEAERQAQNSVIQGAASDLTLLAGIRIMNWIWSTGRKTRLVLTVYDSLVFSVPDDELEDVATFVYRELQQPPEGFNVVVNLEAEMKIGKNWGSLLEVNPEKEEWEGIRCKLTQTF
jgi:DNA polymerase-1